jgi:hypothetical protein
MNVQIGNEAAQFPEKKYINAIFLAVYTLARGQFKLHSPSPHWQCCQLSTFYSKIHFWGQYWVLV